MSKVYFFFKPEGLVIAKDQTGRSQVEMVPYKAINCVNPLGRNAFFFKSVRGGYALFFNGFVVEDAMKWFEALIILVDKDTDSKQEIKLLDITEGFGPMELAKEEGTFAYSFSKCVEAGLGKTKKAE